METSSHSLPLLSIFWPLTRGLKKIAKMQNNQKILIRGLQSRREENDRIIKEVIEFLNGLGKTRRIRPCDMQDADEKECPAGNLIND